MNIKNIVFLLCGMYSGLLAQNDTLHLEEVIISSTKKPETSVKVASTYTILSKEEIKEINPSNSAYLLENSGAAAVQRSQAGGGSPIIRGFEANKVLINIDGIRLNNAIFRGGHLQNVLRIDNAVLERLEVLYGPSNVNFGSDALGGVMNFYTKKPSFNTIGGNIFSRFSSAISEITTHGEINIGKEKWASLTSLTYSAYGDVMQGNVRSKKYSDFGKRNFYVERINHVDSVIANSNPNLQSLSGYYQYDILQKICYKSNENSLHTLNIQFSNTGNVNRYDRLTETKNNLPVYAAFYYGPELRFLAAYTFDKTWNSKYIDKSSIAFSFQNIYESRIQRRFRNVIQKYQQENIQVYGVNMDLYKKFNKHYIQFGGETYFNKVNSEAHFSNIISQNSYAADTRYPNGGSQMIFSGLYLQDFYNIRSDKLILNAGLRLNHTALSAQFSDTTFFHFPFSKITQNNISVNGNLSLKIKLFKRSYLNMLYSNGFRSPNIDDLTKVFESNTDILIVPNPQIKSERTHNVEFSWKLNTSKIKLESGVYFTRLYNALTLDYFKYNNKDSIWYNQNYVGIMAMQNKQKGDVKGVFVNMNIKCGTHLEIYGNMNYTVGKILESGDKTPLDHIPPLYGLLRLEYKNQYFTAMCWTQFNAAKPISEYRLNAEDNEKYATVDGMPAWTTFNAAIQGNITPKTNIILALENILDKNYRSFGSGISSPGRNLRVTLRHDF